MHRQYDTNPHFLPTLDHETPQPPRGLPVYIQPRSRVPRHQSADYWGQVPESPRKTPVPESPQPFLPQHHHLSSNPNPEDDGHTFDFPLQERSKRKLPPPPYGFGSHAPGSRPRSPPRWGGPGAGHRSAHPNQPHYHPSSTMMPTGRKTTPFACLACSLLIVVGLVILIVYLVFRPRNPTFDISNANLNAIYLDNGYLLSADLTLLANFTNPNDKGSIDFKYAMLDLYHDKTPIASCNVDPFPLMNGEYRFQDVRLVTSQVALSSNQSHLLSKQMESGNVWFQVKGTFRTRSNGLINYSYWLYGYCTIVLTYPPPGVLVAKKCTTRR